MPETFKETFKVTSAQLVEAMSRLLREANVRRVVIKHEGRPIVEFPLTVGVIGAVFAPILAAVGALAALIGDCTLEVEREVTGDAEPGGAASAGSAAAPGGNQAPGTDEAPGTRH
jgi:Domain of unknown function (DUF4342)